MALYDSAVPGPIYRQLNASLRGLLSTGEFAEGDQFLTERQIAERFGISRITANKAVAQLVSEQRLEFRKGVGTFVKRGTLDYNLRSLTSFTAMVESNGRKADTKVLSLKKESSGIPELSNEPVFFTERLRLADGQPVIYERRHFIAALCPGIKKSDLRGSIYQLWRERYFLSIVGAEQSIRAVNVIGREAELLGLRPGAAGLLNTSIGYLEDRRPLWFEQTLYRGDAYEFFNRLGYIEAPGAAVGRLITAIPRAILGG